MKRRFLQVSAFSGLVLLFFLFIGKAEAQHGIAVADTCQWDTTAFAITPDLTGISYVLWVFGDPAGKDSSTSYTPTHVFGFFGTFTVTLTINGGTEVIKRTITINPIPKVSDVTTTVCKGMTVTLKPDTGNKMKHYLWNTGETVQDKTFLLVKDTVFTCRNFDNNECHNDAYFYIYALKTNMQFGINSIIQCITNNAYQFTSNADTMNRPWLEFLWDFGDGTNSNLVNPLHQYGAAGVYNVKLNITPGDTVACLDTSSNNVNVISQVPPDFDFSVNKCLNKVITINKSGVSLNYNWDFGDGTVIKNAKDTSHIYLLKGTYNVTLFTNPGTACVDSLIKQVSIDLVDTDIFIPNSFSPNADQVNDQFYVVGLDYNCFPYDLYIYNRWGVKVFESVNSAKVPVWDGKYNGSIVEQGVYFYLVKGKTFKRFGTLTVIY